MSPAPPAPLVEHVYAELRQLAGRHMARESVGRTLQPTALVHEVYLRLLGDQSCAWNDRGQVLAAAALTMRRVLVDASRRRGAERRGGHLRRVALDAASDEAEATAATPEDGRLVELDRALRSLEALDPRMARVVELRYFGGLTIEETASVIDVSPRTVRREWEAARLWLYQRLRGDAPTRAYLDAS